MFTLLVQPSNWLYAYGKKARNDSKCLHVMRRKLSYMQRKCKMMLRHGVKPSATLLCPAACCVDAPALSSFARCGTPVPDRVLCRTVESGQSVVPVH